MPALSLRNLASLAYGGFVNYSRAFSLLAPSIALNASCMRELKS